MLIFTIYLTMARSLPYRKMSLEIADSNVQIFFNEVFVMENDKCRAEKQDTKYRIRIIK